MKNWFCEIRGASVGPLNVAQIQALHASGELGPTPLIREVASGRELNEEDVARLLAGEEVISRAAGDAQDGAADSSGGNRDNKYSEECVGCGREVKWSTSTCPYCGHDSIGAESEAPATVPEERSFESETPSDVVDSFGQYFSGPFQMFGAFVKRLDWITTLKQGGYAVGALMVLLLFCLISELFVDAPITLGFLSIVLAIFVLVTPALITVAFSDFLLLGLGISWLKCSFPGPERTTRAILEVVVSKLIVLILMWIGDVFLIKLIRPSGEPANLLVYGYYSIPVFLYYFLALSIYGQRFQLPTSKSAIINLIAYVPQLLIMLAVLAAIITSP